MWKTLLFFSFNYMTPRKTSDLLRPLLFCQTLTVTRSTPHVLASSEASSRTKSERRKISLSKSFWEGLGLRVTLSCFAWVGIQGWALKNKTPDGPQTMRRVWMGGFSLLNTVTDFVDFLKRWVTRLTRWARCLGMSWRTTETLREWQRGATWGRDFWGEGRQRHTQI